jgi:hypothetical protein
MYVAIQPLDFRVARLLEHDPEKQAEVSRSLVLGLSQARLAPQVKGLPDRKTSLEDHHIGCAGLHRAQHNLRHELLSRWEVMVERGRSQS